MNLYTHKSTHSQRLHTIRIEFKPGGTLQQLPFDMDLFQLLQIAQIFQPSNFVISQIELLEVLQTVQILNLPDVVPLQVQVSQVRESTELLDSRYLVVVEVEHENAFRRVDACLRE